MGGALKTLEIRVLGELVVRQGGRPVALPSSKKTRALLGYLAVTGGTHLRERLCDLLWPGPDDPRAALRWSLTKIRSVLDGGGITRLAADRERVGLEGATFACDLLGVRQALSGTIRDTPTDALLRAATAFQGELLEGLDMADAYRWQEWCVAEREAARTTRLQVLATLVERLAGEPERALVHARERVRVDPLSEIAHADVVRLLHTLGRKLEAQQQYDTCRRILANELGAKPSGALLVARTADVSTSPPPPPAPRSSPAPSTARPSLLPTVGRDDVLGALDAVVSAAAGERSAKVLLVSGDPGIGKTRLLDELAQRVLRAGGRTLRGRAFEAEMVRPYGAWIDALRSVPPADFTDGLAEDLGPLLSDRPTADVTGEKHRLFDAVARLLRQLGTTAPVAVILDDIQWFDEASAALLHFVARAVSPSRVVLACGARDEELADNPSAVRLVRAMQRDGRVQEVALSPLDASATAALARAIDPGVDLERVARESAGNPLFALEIARALAHGGAELSDSLQGLIADRLGRLDERALELAQWAAAFGHAFDLDVLQRVTELPTPDLVSALEELERCSILRASDAASEVAYDFVHDLVRNGAYRRLSPARRRWVHLRIARTLHESLRDDPSFAGDVAHHAALGGDSELAARACLEAAERSLSMFANDEAARLADIALPHIAKLPRDMRLTLLVTSLHLKVLSGRWIHRSNEVAEQLSRATVEAQDAGLQAAAARGFHAIAVMQHDRGEFSAATENTLLAADAGRAADPATTVRQLCMTARCLAMLERETDRAEAMLAEAERAGVGAEGTFVHEWARGMLAIFHGKNGEGLTRLEAVLQLARRDQDRWAECDCLMRMVQVELDEGRPSPAMARCRELMPVAERMGDGSERPAAKALDALARLAACVHGAQEQVAQTTDMLREVDAKGMLAYVLVTAAQLDLRAERIELATSRAREGLAAAETVGRSSLVVLARALLAEAALASGRPDEAVAHLTAVDASSAGAEVSARARGALAHARAAVDQAKLASPA